MIIVLLSFAVCIVGLVLFFLFGRIDARVVRVGEIMFFAGLFVTLLHLEPRMVEIPQGDLLVGLLVVIVLLVAVAVAFGIRRPRPLHP